MMRALFLALCVTVTGCATTQVDTARVYLGHAAEGVNYIDNEHFAPAFEAHVNEVLADGVVDEAEAPELRRWVITARAIVMTRASITTAETTLDAIEQGLDRDVLGVVACVVVELRTVVRALQDVGVEIPSQLVIAVDLLGAYADAQCVEATP